jgi:RNA polymerase sigma-70 factor, ECF subfamily
MLDVVATVSAVPSGLDPLTVRTGQNRVSIDVGHSTGDEADLIRAAQAGDRPAFATLIERYWDRLYRWLCRLTRDATSAEDLTQETFLKAFAAVGRFQAGSNFRAWLFRIGHNNFVNLRRSVRHNRQPLVPEIAEEQHHGPVAEALSREALLLIADAVSKLPSDFRGALTLRVEEGLSFRDIAAVLGITEETARWRVFKARQKLMAVLAPELSSAEPNEPKTS